MYQIGCPGQEDISREERVLRDLQDKHMKSFDVNEEEYAERKGSTIKK
jgi:hypothetical protein